jgi:hypothetical protein
MRGNTSIQNQHVQHGVIHEHNSWVMEHKQARGRTRTRRNRGWESWELAVISLGYPAFIGKHSKKCTYIIVYLF